jgi:large exoprotein involved in heme utilization and adhesion
VFEGEAIRFLGGHGGIAFVDTTSGSTATGDSGPITVRATRSFEIGRGDNPNGWSRMTTSSFGAGRSGNVTIEAPQVTVRGLQAIWSSIFGTGDGGSIRIRAHDVSLFENGEIQAGVFGNATGRGGDIVIEGTGRLYISGFNNPHPWGALITTLTEAPGRAGDIRINMPLVEFSYETGPRISSGTVGAGDAGNIEIVTGRLLSRGGGIEASAFNFSSGNAGNIRIVASEAIELVGRPFVWWEGIFSRTQGTGDPGSISLSAPRIVLDDQRIWATAYFQADGGRIDIDTNELILRNGGQVDARTLPGAAGAAGSVNIRARDRIEISGLSPVDAAFSGINTATNGAGPSGGIRIDTGDLTVDRGFIKSTAGGAGAAGDIDIAARTVSLTNGGRIDASTLPGSSGAGGAINVTATDSIRIAGIDRSPLIVQQDLGPGPESVNERGRPQGALSSTITTSTAGRGEGGRITLTASRIDVVDGGRIEATSTGSGDAGSIGIAAAEALRLFGGGAISTEALAADGGNIDIRVGTLVHLRDAEISTSVGAGQGAGGNIFIDPTFVILENSRIVANAFGGPGGNIRIVAEYLLSSPGSLIDASSRLGTSGSVQIAALNTNLSNELAALPAQVLDASAMLRDACSARVASGGGGSSLVGVGRGGLSASPERFAASSYFATGDRLASTSPEPGPTGLKLHTAQRARLVVRCPA